MDAMWQTASEWAQLHSHEIALAGLFLCAAWAVVNCFAGYKTLRILLVVYGVLAGVAIGVVVAVYLADQQGRASASGMDILVSCGAASALLALASWLLYRLALALGLAAACTLAVAGAFGTPPPPVGWAAGGLVGLAGGVAVFVYTRPLVVLLTALGGAVGAVYYGAAVVYGGEPAVQAMLTGPDRHVETIAALAGLAVLLAIGGVLTQTRAGGVFQSAGPVKTQGRVTPAAAAG